MKLKLIACCLFCIPVSQKLFSQKAVFNYPFKFEKKAFKDQDNAAYLITDESLDKLAMVIHDNKKADYIQLDKNLKVVSKFTSNVNEAIFNKYDSYTARYKEHFVGSSGSSSTGIFNFIYSVALNNNPDKQFYAVETVDFNNKSIKDKEIIERSKNESTLITFTEEGRFYCLKANNEEEQLILYVFNENGELIKKTVPFKVPDGKGKSRNSLTEYLGNASFIRNKEEHGLESGISDSKIFYNSKNISFVINDGASPTHLVNLDYKTMVLTEKFIDHSNEFFQVKKDKPVVKSYLVNDKIFSFIVNSNNLILAEYSTAGQLIQKQEINADNMEKVIASDITSVVKKKKGTEDEVIDDFSKLLKALHSKDPGITVSDEGNDTYIISLGTYEPIIESQSTVGRTHFSTEGFSGGDHSMAIGNGNYINTYYTPGISSYSKSSMYYKSISFKMKVTAGTFNARKTRTAKPLGDQIREYMDDKPQYLNNQFAIGDKQYYGYYDGDTEEYVIENILIKK